MLQGSALPGSVLVGQLLEGFMSSSHVLRSDVSVLKDVPVLVVEDSWHVAKAMKSALEQLGMCVVGPAATTSEARRLAAGQTPRLALVDVNLKKELACDLIEELHGQGIPVIVVSGYAVPPLPERTVAAFLQKPFSESDLITILRATVARLAARLH
jgi:CheY-like chemotaxis protein